MTAYDITKTSRGTEKWRHRGTVQKYNIGQLIMLFRKWASIDSYRHLRTEIFFGWVTQFVQGHSNYKDEQGMCKVHSIQRWYSMRLPEEGWPGWVDPGGCLFSCILYFCILLWAIVAWIRRFSAVAEKPRNCVGLLCLS